MPGRIIRILLGITEDVCYLLLHGCASEDKR
jgi:hypothetical protein